MGSVDAAFPPWTRIKEERILRRVQKRTNEGHYDLSPAGLWWRERYDHLLTHGYKLRERYKPGWVPLWLGTDISPEYCTDSYKLQHPKVIDAIRIADEEAVMIKRIPKISAELSIALLFCSDERRRDPRNHCVPILDVLADPHEADTILVVMPALLRFYEVKFVAISEVLDFMRQTLEALVYIHSQGVAHRDYSTNNIMLDGSPLYSNGFLAIEPRRDRSGLHRSNPRYRYESPPVRYYVIDFGLSTLFEDDNGSRLVTGTFAQDQDVPELSKTIPYDPFLVDVFTLGNLFRQTFVQEYANLQFLHPLVDSMTNLKPEDRPTAEEALRKFDDLVSRCSRLSLSRPLHRSGETLSVSLSKDFSIILRRCKNVLVSFFSTPFALLPVVAVAVAGVTLSHVVGRRQIFTRIMAAFRRTRT